MNQFNILINPFRIIILLIILSFSPPANGQKTSNGTSPQFLFPAFDTGIVRMKNGLSQGMLLNYNTVTEKIVYEKENEVYDLINIGMIDAVLIHEQMFAPVGKIFHEVLLIAPIPLLVQYKGEIMMPGKDVGYGSKSLVSSVETLTSVKLSMGYYNLKLPVDYSVKIEKLYLTGKDGNSVSFVNEKQFLKIFPDKESELKSFIKSNHIRFDRSTDVKSLVKYCNELYPPMNRIS
jgi:hypothetical protein